MWKQGNHICIYVQLYLLFPPFLITARLLSSPHPLPRVCVCVFNVFILGCVCFIPFLRKGAKKKLKCTRKIICSNLITLISKARAGGQFPQPAICIFNLEYTITDQPAFNVLVPNKTHIYFSNVCKVKLFFLLPPFDLSAVCRMFAMAAQHIQLFLFLFFFFYNFCHILIIVPEDSVSFSS